jgi:pimeloyl-ACP methyl ester carboxylesterase
LSHSPGGAPFAAAGGFLAANLAAHHPDAVRGVVLLNAAPFTSPYIPGRDLLLWRLLAAAADDSLPAPREVSAELSLIWLLSLQVICIPLTKQNKRLFGRLSTLKVGAQHCFDASLLL